MIMTNGKLVIDFGEYRSLFNETGDVAEKAQCCIEEINKAVSNFFLGVTTVEHHGFYLHGKSFNAEVDASVAPYDIPENDLISLNISDDIGIIAEYCFNVTKKLVITKTNNDVIIDCE